MIATYHVVSFLKQHTCLNVVNAKSRLFCTFNVTCRRRQPFKMEQSLQHYVQLLNSCNTHSLIRHGKQLHLLFFKKGIFNSIFTIGNRLIQMYSRCGSMEDARKVFDEMPQKNSFTWNTLIEGYMRSGFRDKSLELFYSMPDKNDFSWNVVISGYSKTGDLGMAKVLFDDMPKKNGIAWNSMIHGLLSFGYPKEALKMFKDLTFDQDEVSSGRDGYVLASIVGACTDLMALDCGKQIHARIIIDNVDFDSVLASSLINMYCKCADLDNAALVLNMMRELDDFSASALITGYANAGRIDKARRIFDKFVNPCVIVWNSMISGYIFNNEEEEALDLFDTMRRNGICEDCSTLSSILCACSSTGKLQGGKELHAHVRKIGVLKDAIVGCALIDMYSKCKAPIDACQLFSELEIHDTVLLNSMINVYSNCGRVQEAKKIFDTICQKTLISWNSMIVCLSQNGLPLEALNLFREMNKQELQMDKFSLASIISACASISSLEYGEQCFGRTVAVGLDSDPIICTALIDLYCKCGFVDCGRYLFDSMVKPDLVAWNSILLGYATNGYGNEALILFSKMTELQPKEITFMAILSGCGHCGLVNEARKWFNLMQYKFQIVPGFEHYSCMIDLYSRAGCVEEAMELIEQMAYKADASMWCSVLRGCVTHGHKDLAKKVAGFAIELEPDNSVAYVQLCGVLAGLEDWEGSERVRNVMKEKHIEKNPGVSWA